MHMEKKPLHLGLHSLPIRQTPMTDAEALDQWNRGPKVLRKSIAQLIIDKGRSSKATPAEQISGSSEND